jgi:hypothetical protein
MKCAQSTKTRFSLTCAASSPSPDECPWVVDRQGLWRIDQNEDKNVEAVDVYVPPIKSTVSSISSRPMRISRERFDWGRVGMCGFCTTWSVTCKMTTQTWRFMSTRMTMVMRRMTRRTTHARDDLALHEQPDGGVDAVDVALHRQLEVVLGLVPLHCDLSSAYSSLHHIGALRSPCEIKGTEASTCMGERE